MKAFVREKKIICGGNLVAAAIFSQTENRDMAVKGKRGKREKISTPKQRDLNDKNSKRYFNALAKGNFGEGDMVIHSSYADKHLPKTLEEANRQLSNYMRRVNALSLKKGLGKIKYLAVTQIGEKKNGTHRIHHHILISGGLSRDEVENLWRIKKQKGQKEGELIGWVNADRLRPNENGISQMAGYMARESAGKRRWTCSQNLDKPWSRKNDSKYTKRQLSKIARLPKDCEEYKKFWAKQYPGHTIVDIEQVQIEETNEWSFYIQLQPEKSKTKVNIRQKGRCDI